MCCKPMSSAVAPAAWEVHILKIVYPLYVKSEHRVTLQARLNPCAHFVL